MKRSLREIADFLQARLVGDGSIEITGIASIRSASARDLVFVNEEKNLEAALQSRAAAVIAGEFAEGTKTKALLIAKHPRLAFSRAGQLLAQPAKHQAGVHATAVLHPSAKIGDGVTIEAHAVLNEQVVVGRGTRIGAGCSLGTGVIIGDECVLEPNVSIYPGTKLGNRVIVHAGAVLGSDGFGFVRDPATGRYEKFPQMGRLEIGDDVEIGANATIDRGALDITRIGRGTKIDNLVHIGHNCDIGEDVVIAAQTGLSGSVTVHNGVVMGGQVGIGDHARIEEGAILGGGAGVLSSKVVRGKGIVFWGRPARPVKAYLKELAALARLGRK